MISKKLLHKAINKTQEIMGAINLSEVAKDTKTREQHTENAKYQLRQLVALLERHVKKNGEKKS